MSIGSIIAGGIRLVRTQPQIVAIWAALYLVVTVVGMVAMRPWLASMTAFQQQIAINAAARIKTPPVLPTDLFGQLFLAELVLAVFMIVAFAAVVRAVVSPGGDRFAYLRLGMVELRLIGLCILLAILGFAAELVAILALVIVGVLGALVLGKAATAVIIGILAVALFCGAIYVEVRISLAGALTVMRGRIIIGEAWRVTKGRFWTLFGAYALLSIAFFVIFIVVLALTNLHLLTAYASLDQHAINAAAQEQLARQGAGLSAGLIVQMVLAAILGVTLGTVGCGAIATAALELGGMAPLGEGTGEDRSLRPPM